jgi:membrane-associated phospholipid phosphatase
MGRRNALLLLSGLLVMPALPAWADSVAANLVPSAHAWLTDAKNELGSAPPPTDAGAEMAELRALAAGRGPADVARFRWWDMGGPAYRWNELTIEALLDDFVTLPLAARHLALVHAAVDDAVAAAWADKRRYRRPRPHDVDPSLATLLPALKDPSYPSDYAAAAAAGAAVLGTLFPQRAAAFAAAADEAMRSRLLAGVEFPSDIAAGREIGRKVAALAIARAKSDRSDAKWTGSVPQGSDKWQGTNPIAPMAGTWRPWVLAQADEFRPAAPPAVESERVKTDLAELKSFKRTPKSNHRAVYWEVFGGARAHALWNETARMKLLEYGDAFDAPASARVLATLNIVLLDAAIACWDAKYAYWFIRPSQLDPDLKPVFPPPNHPSYPAAHGCLSTAATTVLAALFPPDRDRLLAQGKEAAEARIWAGIHYRFDIDAGQDLGRKVAEKVLAQAFRGKP